MSDGQSDSRREMDSGGWTLNNAPPVRSGDLLSGVELIAEERQRQISQEGWTPEHDDNHDRCELAKAAACYAIQTVEARHLAGTVDYLNAPPLGEWPWDEAWWKPKDPIRDLVKAGALIAAEIDRLRRA